MNDIDMITIRQLIAIAVLALLVACGSSGEAKKSENSPQSGSSRVQVDNPSITLADYLRRVPGIMIQGSGDDTKVNIRGAQSIEGGSEPLFVIDGQRVGNSYSKVTQMLEVNDIDHVEVLKGSEASTAYGMAGSNGVIIIRTKRK